MKRLKLFIIALVFFFISCENSNSDKRSSTPEYEQNTLMLELSDSFDQDDEMLNDDIDQAFDSFELGFSNTSIDSDSRAKNTGSGTYDLTTGYWVKTVDEEFNRIDSMYRNNELIIRDQNIDKEGESKARFEDNSGNPIEDVKANKDNIVKILMERSGSLKVNGKVSIYDINNSLIKDITKDLTRDEKSNNATLSKLEEEGKWSLVGQSEKDVNLSLVTLDSSKTIDKTVVTDMDVIVKKGERKKGRFGKKRRGHFVGGTITRTITIDGDVIIIVTTFYDSETDAEGRLFTRTVTKNGELVDESTVYPGEKGQRKHLQRGGKRGGKN